MGEDQENKNEYRLFQTMDGSFTLIEPNFEEAYHSKAGARYEAQELYVTGSGFQDSLRDCTVAPFSVLDVGLGLGYNALAGVDAWLQSSGARKLYLLSLESNEALIESFLSGQAPWQQGWDLGWLNLTNNFQKDGRCWVQELKREDGAQLTWVILPGDATKLNSSRLLPTGWPLFRYLWQDPFSPKKTPDLWSLAWFELLRSVSTPDAILVTYSVARMVRDHLTAAGWSWEKKATNGSKRWWLRACPVPPPSQT